MTITSTYTIHLGHFGVQVSAPVIYKEVSSQTCSLFLLLLSGFVQPAKFSGDHSELGLLPRTFGASWCDIFL